MSPVLLISELFPPDVGGSAELVANVYARFQIHPVTVLTAPGDHTHADFRLHVRRESPRTTHWGLLQPAGWAHHFSTVRRIRRLSTPSGTVVHCGRVLPEGLHAWLARRTGGRPYTCWAHGEELTYAELSREFRALMTRILREASAVFANSRNTARLLGDFGVDSDRIVLVYPGVDTARFAPKRGEHGPLRQQLARQGEVVLLTVGRLQRRKGHDLVIQSLEGLRDLPVRYVIVGDGPERPRLEQLVDALHLRSVVTFAGVAPAAVLPDYYAAADIFVHPNRVEGLDFEGFGIVFIEAAAAGLPVIGGASGGVVEAVEDGVNGVLVSGSDVTELQAAIRRLVTDQDLREAMGGRGRAWAARFTWDRAAAAVESVHARVAGASGA